MSSPSWPVRTSHGLLLLTGALLGVSTGCESRTKPSEPPSSFRVVALPASESKDTLHPILLRARTLTPKPGVEPALGEQWAQAVERGAPTLHLIAQFGRLPDEKQWALFAEQGLHRAAFLHGRSFLLRVELSKEEGDERLEQIREELGALALLRFAPEDRVPPALLEGKYPEEARVEGTEWVRVGVLLFPRTSKETVERLIQLAHRGPDAPEQPGETLLVLETDAEGLHALSQEDAVHDVGARTPPLPLLHRVRESTGAEWVQALDTSVTPPVYQGLSGAGVRISLGSESPDVDHDDFWNHDAQGARTTVRAVYCGNLTPDGMHGSHVSGIAMGNGFMSQGRYRGLAPRATGVCYGQRPDVSNHSYVDWGAWGAYNGSSSWEDQSIRDPASTYHHLHVQAVGNNGVDPQSGTGNVSGYYSVLAAQKNALTVANIDSLDHRWGGSSIGPTLDGRTKPDMAAPGSLTRFPDRSQVLFELDSVSVLSGSTPVVTWDFDTPGQFQGWAATSSWIHQGCIGAVSSTSTGSGWAMSVPMLPRCKPWVATHTTPSGATLALPADATHSVSLRYRFEPTPMWNEEQALLWWSPNSTNPSDYQWTQFPIIPDGQWHTVTVNVGQLATWRGRNIQLLRISPVAHTNRAIISTAINNDYIGNGGSSMAAPAVTGTAALMLERMVTRYGVVLTQQGAPSPFWQAAPGVGVPMPSTFKALLVHSAKDLASIPRFAEPTLYDTGGSPVRYHKGPDFVTGYGALDVAEALRLVDDGTYVERSLSTGVLHQHLLTVPGGSTTQTQPLKVTLAWDDAPGSTGTAQVVSRLVNDLDLVLVDPNGQRHYPWTLEQPYVPSGPSQTPDVIEPEPISPANILPAGRTREDHLNNLEQVYVENPMPGTWTVEVRPGALAAPPQRYSIVLGTPSRPALNLTGGRVAWSSTRTTPAQIFSRVNQPGAPVQQLTSGAYAAVGPVWAPSGQMLAYVTDELVGGAVNGSLIVINASGTVAARWHRPLNTRYVTHPSWSWDARHLAFGYYDAWGCQGLGVLDFAEPYAFSTATARVLVPATCAAGHLDPTDPDFSHDGAWVYFSSATDHPWGEGGLYRIPTSGGAIERIHGDGVPLRRAYAVSLSSDGKRVVYNSELHREDPVRYQDEEALSLDLETGVTTQLTFEPGHQYAYFATGGTGEMILQSNPLPSGNPAFYLVENGERRLFDTGNAGQDTYPTWWKREPRCLATPSGLRAWYALDELLGSGFLDYAGGNMGTASGATSVQGMVRQGLAFNASASASAPAQTRLNVGTGDFALAAWVKLSTTGTHVLLDKRQAAPLRGYHLVASNNCLLLQLADTGGFSNYLSTVCLTPGTWHHVAVSVRRNQASGIQFYLDGAAAQTFSSMARNGSLDSTSDLVLGRRSNDATGHMDGGLDEVMLFGRALDGAEVQRMAQAGPSGVCR